MARVVDSEQRRAAVSAGVWRVMAEDGIEALSLRAVARAANCTTSMVLHYFADRRDLMLHARRLMHERMLARVAAAGSSSADPASVLRDVLAQSLPLDARRRDEARVWVGFLAAAMHDERLAEEHRRHNRAWQRRIAALVRAVRPAMPAARAAHAARRLVALTDGLATLASVAPDDWSPRRQRALLASAITDAITDVVTDASTDGVR